MAPRFLREAVVFLFFANLPACSSGGRCGDGRPASGEGCDDGNVADGDGCSAQCLVEEGYTCLGAPSVCTRPTHCGDGLVEEDEECDDNNTTDGDGCSAECLAEKDFFCSGAPSSCVKLSSCGNGRVESPTEKCDDENRENGDGCNFLCQVEPGFDCSGEPSACRLSGAVYYVRADGGDDTQCDGRSDAAYSGSGQNQPCAWKHPFYALDQTGAWKLKGGEALIIGPGSYRMGLDAPGAERFCSAEYPWDCHLPPLPPGPDAAHPTRLMGAGYANGCQQRPELWGAERAYHIVDLSGSSNAVVDCLEITDHSGCALAHCTASVACPRETSPYGDYADVGVLASDAENLVLRRLNVHGLAAGGVHAARLRNFTMEKVRIAGNGSVGFDGDLGEDSSNRGLIRFLQVTVEWNGCPEQWPDGQNNHCWGQNVCGGYGDGVGVARSGGRWLLDGCLIRYNTSDGLDLLYVGVNRPSARVEVRNSMAYGNAGNQFKVGGVSRIINSVAVGNCAYFQGKPFAAEMGDFEGGDICRAGGGALSLNLPRGGESRVINCTLASAGWAVIEAQCNNLDFPDQPACDAGEKVYIVNNVVRGYQVAFRQDERPSDLVGDGDPYHFTSPETVHHNLLWHLTINSPIGEHNLQLDPLLQADADIDAFDGHLKENSPAIDAGVPVGGLIPAFDSEGKPRPFGAGVDLGAYERQ